MFQLVPTFSNQGRQEISQLVTADQSFNCMPFRLSTYKPMFTDRGLSLSGPGFGIGPVLEGLSYIPYFSQVNFL
ncbi:MAG: hypothetical protein OI74_09375 [Gammaproteobacteria bacterium (ex Lamellibrachia satsuma)]|nr:MAG: hypothetical protein OI74_09375 [Gammaproteobacteria bacterium (ex Lamellibrachia satsuma)]RRS36638.1 MAG: hypothetical protein NV67_06045 [Gammaproteobacteria bacterium (ex Lamellibrachia satsuma)]